MNSEMNKEREELDMDWETYIKYALEIDNPNEDMLGSIADVLRTVHNRDQKEACKAVSEKVYVEGWHKAVGTEKLQGIEERTAKRSFSTWWRRNYE